MIIDGMLCRMRPECGGQATGARPADVRGLTPSSPWVTGTLPGGIRCAMSECDKGAVMTEFSSTGWIALFSDRQANVEGWDLVTRTALVADTEKGLLKPVTDYPDFQRLVYAHKVIGAIPASPGHRAHWANFEGGVPRTESIVGWLVTERAGVLPLTADGATAEDADLMLEPGEEAPFA
ncbi:hypothetical protein ACFVAM_00810 [Streptomyces californicus]|uniref:hypothetical protein n=1 Tax=Streptomyces californicus TaxID=67351 RepID=UPI003693540A